MRHIFLAILLHPLLRQPPACFVRAQVQTLRNIHKVTSIPHALEYPSCRASWRSFSSAVATTGDTTSRAPPDASEAHQYAMAGLNPKTMAESDCAEAAAKAEASVKAQYKEEAKKEEEEKKLPKLSSADFHTYNHMAEHMDYFHNRFRESWNILHEACANNRRPAGLSLKQFINKGIQFASHLTTHHGVEEEYIFPVLARKMPEFKAGKNRAELLRQHDEIHTGMHEFEDYLQKCVSGEKELDLKVLKEKMDSWGEVLWKHLDQEVKTLSADNMRKYWTLDEMKRMPM